MRLISFILFLIGAAAVAFGVWTYFGKDAAAPESEVVAASEVVVTDEPEPAAAAVPAESVGVPEGAPGFDSGPGARELSLPPPPPAPEASDEGESILGVASLDPDPLLQRLKTVPIAYEAPAAARKGQVFEVTLSIDGTGAESAVGGLPGRGEITEAEAKVSETVMASLTGANFTITARSPETQKLSPLAGNTWRWDVKPEADGAQDLTLEIYAIVDDLALPVRTYRSKVAVNISTVQQVIDVARSANPLFVILGGIGSLLAGLFGMVRFFRGA